MTVHHQFLDSEYFYPNWEVNTLFLGTFNPVCGERLDYYYRRRSNGFWKILKYYDTTNEYDFSDFQSLKRFMGKKRFGCVDVIRSVTFPNNDRSKICGDGYTDSNLFRVRGYTREYNFEQIKEYVRNNEVSNILTTWGDRKDPNEFKDLLQDFKSYCLENGINFINLKSPSGRLYRGDRVEEINSNWLQHLTPILQI
jgi:hypothetical protein